MWLIKVTWYVLRVKNMHSGSPLDPWGWWCQAKLSNAHENIRQGKAKLSSSKLTSVFQYLPNVGPMQLCVLVHLGCTRKASSYFLILRLFVGRQSAQISLSQQIAHGSKFKTNQYRKIRPQIFDMSCENVSQIFQKSKKNFCTLSFFAKST